ncbi:ATP-binding protein [Pseudoalteromonas luteoviolacea]|uniref:histidine kinase n=1 Tax=Pseudoalteromonas luteoviolacea (strain 2ta16) TaxID=1353533 RepID=V4HZP4_PSEL2|nr:ATP-binding protein [Pseudoalteromonas luteoviolacea]ESP93434.1 signal transduction histidine kinase [Pseudoalteromonas luteoviolacea 2ta16]KZN43908.1 hypothetical protein N483_08285 [Pseudoalteromonas luteoviolacea NCIMB 1944]
MDSKVPHLVTNDCLQIQFISAALQTLLGEDNIIGMDLNEVFNLELISGNFSLGHYNNIPLSIKRFPCETGYCFLIQTHDSNKEEMSFLIDAVASSNIGVWRYNLASHSLYLSDIAKKLLGIAVQTPLTWRKLLSLVHKDDQALFPLFFENHVQFGVPLQFEFRLKSSGQKSWFALRGSCIHKPDGKWINGTLQDCTAEKTTVIALNDADESKQLAIEAGKIGTWRATKSGNQWHWKWDMLANTIFKLEPEDIGDLNKWVELLHPEDKPRVKEALDESLRTGIEFKQHYRSILKNGEVIYVFAQGRVGKNYKGEHCRIDGVCVDQTEIHNTQQALKKLNSELETRVNDRTAELHNTLQKAERANKIKSEFLSMISHELRTPLNGIIGALDLLSHFSLSCEPKDLVYTASKSADHLITILNDLLDLNKIEAGKLELETTVFNLPTVIYDVVSTFTASAKDKGIKLKVYENQNEVQPIKGDINRFKQILLNILGNAIKFTNSDCVRSKEITVISSFKRLNIYQSEVTVSISDTGVGMSNETIKKLFTPFTQAEKSTTRKFGGTGLGLSICGKLIDLMGGQIIVTSELNKGSQFTVKAPFWVELGEKDTPLKSALNCFTLGKLSHDNQHVIQLLQSLYTVTIVPLECQDLMFDQNIGVNIILTSDFKSLLTHIDTLNSLETLMVYTDLEHVANFELTFPHLAVFSNQPLTYTQFETQIKIQQQDNLALDELEFAIESSDSQQVQTPFQMKSDEGFGHHDILLVEDNPFNQKLIQTQLAKLGLFCDIANNGAEGFSYWHSHTYKLILTDCHMPEVDGYEMTKQIRTEEARREKPPIPIIAVTGAAMQGERDLCTSIGMNDFLCKPVRLTDIRSILERWYEHTA